MEAPQESQQLMSRNNPKKDASSSSSSSSTLRKEFENNQLISKIADEQSINNQFQKKMKELHVRKTPVYHSQHLGGDVKVSLLNTY